MPAWNRLGWLALMSGAALLGTPAEAGRMTSPRGARNWWFPGQNGPGYLGASPATPAWTPPAPVAGPARQLLAVTSAPVSAPDYAVLTRGVVPAPPPVSVAQTPVSYASLFTTPAVAAPAPAHAAHGFINLGSGPYPEANLIAGGSPQPWYTSPQVAALFGGAPDARQQADFTASVLNRVLQTFQSSGVSVNLTADPSVHAAHTLSLVSNSFSIPFPNSIGTSDVGGSGFSFVDPIAKSVQNVDQLASVVAHNVAHELMLTFGVPEKYDQTGAFIDATNASMSMMTSPDAKFSPAAAQALNQALQAQNNPDAASPLPQYVGPHPVPEPSTFLVWGLGAVTLGLISRKVVRR